MENFTNHLGEEKQVEIYFSHEFKNHGQWNIIASCEYKGIKNTFKFHSTDSQFIDKLSDLRANNATWEDIQEVYKTKALNDTTLGDYVLDWIMSIEVKITGAKRYPSYFEVYWDTEQDNGTINISTEGLIDGDFHEFTDDMDEFYYIKEGFKQFAVNEAIDILKEKGFVVVEIID